VLAAAVGMTPGIGFGDEAGNPQTGPLHRQVDAMIAQKAQGQPAAPPANDAEFVRRVYLDLAGRIPSAQELQAFLADSRSEKRAALVEVLLNGPDYPRRMQDLFHAMLMERRGDNPQWRTFLRSAFEANEPWDQLAREILDPDPEDPAKRGAAYFYTQRLDKVGQQETDYPGLTRDVGRLFLGMDLQCAQCHNHLFIDDYKQQDFQGLFVVFQNTSIRRDVKYPAIAEQVLTKKIEFMSVFDKVPLAVGPRVPGGRELEIPTFEKGQEYLVPPDRAKNFPGIPRFSPLEAVAHELPSAKNAAFARNIANRLWFVMLGRGLVHPLDQHHSANPPSHAELLELLTQEIVAHHFDIRWMLGELAASETYQRSSIPPAGTETPPQSFLVANEKRLSAEQLMGSMLQATGPWVAEGVAQPEAVGSADDKKTPDAAAESPEARLRAAFVKAYGNPPQDPEIDFNPSLKSALFLLNSPLVLELLVPKSGNLMDRAASLPDAAVADELYRNILTREPTDEERSAANDYLAKQNDRRTAALADLAWSLLASTEFAVNH
jgi:hypothetical protein